MGVVFIDGKPEIHINEMKILKISLVLIVWLVNTVSAQDKPNIVLIYADDLGYGDVSSYGATKVSTPHIDALANNGLKFENAFATSSTCTPSRYSMLTGKYAWRASGTDIAPGDAALIIPTTVGTLPKMLQQVGYVTGVVGKWHLGLGLPGEGVDWNGEIKPGPLEVGFDYCFVIPATADRVPTVYLENRHIVDLDPADPIVVDYKDKVGDEPTGAENPELLKMQLSEGHDKTIVNGISRIGYMSGGHNARWKDEDIAMDITEKSIAFIDKNKDNPFFLFLATNDIHVPRSPNELFVGKSGLGPRGDVILQLDWTVGKVVAALDSLGLTENTLIIVSSDNGPVLDDGYVDFANEMLNGHEPAGIYRGGKYSAYDAGTRVPFIVHWPGQVARGISHAHLSQIDLYATFAAMYKQDLAKADAPDSFNLLDALLGKDKRSGRKYVVQHALNGTLSLIEGDWKYIEPASGPKVQQVTRIELGNSPVPQLFNLAEDPGEQNNLYQKYPNKLKEMEDLLGQIKKQENDK